jgi:hypothetical protein
MGPWQVARHCWISVLSARWQKSFGKCWIEQSCCDWIPGLVQVGLVGWCFGVSRCWRCWPFHQQVVLVSTKSLFLDPIMCPSLRPILCTQLGDGWPSRYAEVIITKSQTMPRILVVYPFNIAYLWDLPCKRGYCRSFAHRKDNYKITLLFLFCQFDSLLSGWMALMDIQCTLSLSSIPYRIHFHQTRRMISQPPSLASDVPVRTVMLVIMPVPPQSL